MILSFHIPLSESIYVAFSPTSTQHNKFKDNLLQAVNSNLCEVVTTLTLLWTTAVLPSPPDFCSPLLLPVCQLEATSSSSSSSLSQTNLSGHNRLPLQLCCFWNGNPSARLVLSLGWQKLAKKTLFLDGFISLSRLTVVFLRFSLLSGCLLLLINVEVVWSWPPSWGSLQDVKSFSLIITFHISS